MEFHVGQVMSTKLHPLLLFSIQGLAPLPSSSILQGQANESSNANTVTSISEQNMWLVGMNCHMPKIENATSALR